jgi:hypothetical protein
VRVLVCGGRDYRDRGRVYDVLDELHQAKGISAVVHGAARGADSLADGWAMSRGVKPRRYPVSKQEWETFGRRAGVMRNQRMLDSERIDLVVAFPGDRGTADMKRRAAAAGVEVMDVDGKQQRWVW